MRDTASSTCVIVRPGDSYDGKQGLTYFSGISTESAGSRGICMHLLNIPPGGRARPHLHESHETAIYVMSGEAEMMYGEGLREQMTVRAGEFLYIPAGMPHMPYNRSESEPCVAVLARTDPNEQESVVLLDDVED
ncbi:MAG: cupin domain-containing protein [Bacteroidetes bacterium]|nr:cupin domain-containing protein [Bacteroidota bacterium]